LRLGGMLAVFFLQGLLKGFQLLSVHDPKMAPC
jgi:hypothetical protein